MNQYHVQNNFNYLYDAVEGMRRSLSPMRSAIILGHDWLNSFNPVYDNGLTKIARASLIMAERFTRKYRKPSFAIVETNVDGQTYDLHEQVVLSKTFCNLLHFRKLNCPHKQPKLLIVAPMSGHHATLLKGTVKDTLPHFDVYITDWIDASQVPVNLGQFNMDDFIDYVINFLEFLGPEVHVMAVCQPTVPVLAAVAIMSANENRHVPRSMIMIGGPIDARSNPTVVNSFASDRSIEWFESMVITMVPENYPGHLRHVYPGFLQLSGFIQMNLQRHIDSHYTLFKDLLIEDGGSSEKQKEFYDEYLAVMDLPAEFYLQTITEVFHEFSLAKGTLVSNGRKVNLKAIKNCALLGIEGEKDDIAAIGQTKASLGLCANIPENKKRYHLQAGAGHYGVFSGSKFRECVVPVMKEFVHTVALT